MTHTFQAALRELRMFPSRPVRVCAEGMVIELRVIPAKTGSTLVSSRPLPTARLLTSNRWDGRVQ